MMPSLLNWMWQSTLCLGACWLLYWAVLRREACFGYNRAYLLLTPLLAALAPLLPWEQWWPVAAAVRKLGMPTVVLPVLHVGAGPQAIARTTDWLLVLYISGAAASLLLLGLRLGRLWLLTRRLPAIARPGYTLRLTGGQLPVSSFGRTVYWDDTAPLSAAEAEQVLMHELAHVRQGHSADRLWLELCRAALWFSPLMYCYPRALALTHEYLADAAALGEPGAKEPGSYARLLAQQATAAWQSAPALAHTFATSNTLNRIRMLHHLQSTAAWRKWAVLPMAATVLMLVACEKMNSLGTPPPPPPAAPEAPVAPPPPPAPPMYRGTEQVHSRVDKMPEYQGGMSHLMHDLGTTVKYPAEAAAAKLAGKVFVHFVVEPDGRISGAEVLKGIEVADKAQQPLADALNQAAVRAVQQLPGRWIPGEQNGRPVRVAYTIPISFAL
ncbi:M56 family metallopeptidase [Hymenobacter latericus]|uniref:M56 family metallopeptidase n=1 Tax=Hymenobacter sp. YIM 151858-1 TaxID=2987688 RepID=UPI002225F333|nr:M56 family metallopeptidase [Hymenobacter sp. YIM 151858-1]UYZ58570.1 M56 family metallopeptidase [Hymenobacter sp. YIM 151858-1]